jgi:hypothetical protein
VHQALPLRLHQRAPRFKPQLRVARVAGRDARCSRPVQQGKVETGNAEARDAALQAIGDGGEGDRDGRGAMVYLNEYRYMIQLRKEEKPHLDRFKAFIIAEIIGRYFAGDEHAIKVAGCRAVQRQGCCHVDFVLEHVAFDEIVSQL